MCPACAQLFSKDLMEPYFLPAAKHWRLAFYVFICMPRVISGFYVVFKSFGFMLHKAFWSSSQAYLKSTEFKQGRIGHSAGRLCCIRTELC